MKTSSTRATDINQLWYVVDADGRTLGRLATRIATYLRGKHKPEYTPHVDTGDYVIVINASKINVTGNKYYSKTYYRHSGYPGGLKSMTFEKMIARFPSRPIELAVKGMLPKGSLGSSMYRKLKVYSGDKHPHSAQNPFILSYSGKQ